MPACFDHPLSRNNSKNLRDQYAKVEYEYDFFTILYADMGPYFGWNWDEFEEFPYPRMKELNSMMRAKLDAKSILGLRQVEFIQAIIKALGLQKDN